MAAGDVTENGSIELNGLGYIAAGRVIVTPEQAEAASGHGWEVIGEQGDKILIAKGQNETPAIRT